MTKKKQTFIETHVDKWGNSLAVRIPKPIAALMGLEQKSVVRMHLEGTTLVIRATMPEEESAAWHEEAKVGAS